MSGSIQVEIPSEVLLKVLNERSDETPDRLNTVANESGFIAQEESVIEAPYITHNLETSIQIGEDGPLTRIVYPDEGIAPYALFVILAGVKRRYAGNPFFDRAQPKTEARIQSEPIADFLQWAGDI